MVDVVLVELVDELLELDDELFDELLDEDELELDDEELLDELELDDDELLDELELDDDELLDELELDDDELLDEDELELDDEELLDELELDDELPEPPEAPPESVPPVSAMVRRLGSVGDEEPPQPVSASRRTQQRPSATPAESLRIGVRFMTFLLEPKWVKVWGLKSRLVDG